MNNFNKCEWDAKPDSQPTPLCRGNSTLYKPVAGQVASEGVEGVGANSQPTYRGGSITP